MNIIITGHQLNLSNYLKTFISNKTSSKLSHFENRLHNVNIILEKEGLLYKCDIDATSDFGNFHSTASSEIPETAIDQSLDKIIHEIKKKHDKLIKHH